MMDEQPTQRTRIECTIWHSPLFHVVPDGLEIRCKSCRGLVHHVKRAELERIWEEFIEERKDDSMASQAAL